MQYKEVLDFLEKNRNYLSPLGSLPTEKRYEQDDEILKEFIKQHPENTCRKTVYHKIILINAFYSTRMGADICFEAANWIVENAEKFDKTINCSDVSERTALVKELQNPLSVESRKYTPRSFMTKYCAIHSRYCYGDDFYPIYDSMVSKFILKYFNEKINKNNLKDYEKFYKIVDEIRNICQDHINIEITFKQLDNFMWRYVKYRNKEVN